MSFSRDLKKSITNSLFKIYLNFEGCLTVFQNIECLNVNKFLITTIKNNNTIVQYIKKLYIYDIDVFRNKELDVINMFFPQLTTLIFYKTGFDSSLNLNFCSNLEIIDFGNSFNKELGNLFNNLTNLKSLNFGNSFNKPLKNSLNNLIQLETLN
jgi:hypothetical protein